MVTHSSIWSSDWVTQGKYDTERYITCLDLPQLWKGWFWQGFGCWHSCPLYIRRLKYLGLFWLIWPAIFSYVGNASKFLLNSRLEEAATGKAVRVFFFLNYHQHLILNLWNEPKGEKICWLLLILDLLRENSTGMHTSSSSHTGITVIWLEICSIVNDLLFGEYGRDHTQGKADVQNIWAYIQKAQINWKSQIIKFDVV